MIMCIYMYVYMYKWRDTASSDAVSDFYLMFIYFWERDRTEREGDTESNTGSRLPADSTEPFARLKPMSREIMTWAKVGRLTNWVSQEPPNLCLILKNLWSSE